MYIVPHVVHPLPTNLYYFCSSLLSSINRFHSSSFVPFYPLSLSLLERRSMVSSANSTNQRLFVDAINQHIHNQAKQVKILCEARFPNGDIACQSYPARVIVSSVHSFRAHPAPAHTFKPSIMALYHYIPSPNP